MFEVNGVWNCERRVHVGIYASTVIYLLVTLIIQVIMDALWITYRVSRSHFTTNYVASVSWEVLLNIYLITDPHNKPRVYQLLFTYNQTILMKYLNSKQNLRPEKGIYSYLVKFYRTIDTIYAEYTGLFLVFLLCPCVSSAATLWNESRAGIRLLIT